MEAKKTGAKFYKKDLDKWLADDDANCQLIVIVGTDKKKHQFNFTIGGEELKFDVRYPFKTGEGWKVDSSDLDTSWAKEVNKIIKKATGIKEVLDACTTQYEALDDEAYSGDDYDDDGEEAEDDFNFTEEPAYKPKKNPEPEVDTSMFQIPHGYEPSCIQSIIQEYKNVLSQSREERQFDAQPMNDNIAQWEIKLFGIPTDEPLYKDMRALGIEHITLHVVFPPNYPFAPPFLRVVRPRFAFRTGHVTIGGAICTHVLTNDGWIATYRLPQILVDVRAMMISGNGRLDMSNRSDYSEHEALDALRRLLATHGWKHWKA
eukprot:TRINITY_DN629_c0_g1_i1.p1 TRINITY_DN629_c0_g1~~TRINITY_DN629_c0_g1_i1.p1  ORF type:complete len:318 (-),score=77.70 TRINITY_DN629_c0_g1_i1:66-1019(-)